MNKTTQYIIVGLLLIIAALTILTTIDNYNTDNKEDAVRILETQLKSTRQQRDSILLLNNRSDSITKALYRLIDKKDQELSRINGRYNKYTVPELEVEMERKANGN